MNRPKRATYAAVGSAALFLSLLASGCGDRGTTAKDPAASSATPRALTKQLPTPTGSPVSKELVRREAEAQAASPIPRSPQRTGEVPTDDVYMMTHYANRRFVPTYAWRLLCGDRYDTLAVGAVDGTGYVVMAWSDVTDDGSATQRLAAPDGVGSLRIVSARCDGVRVRDRAGHTLTYRLTTNSWAD